MYGGMVQDLRFGGFNRGSFRPIHIVDDVNTPAQVSRQKEAAAHTRRVRRTLEQQGEGQTEHQPKKNLDGTRSNDPAAELRKMLGIDSARAGPVAGFRTAQTGGAQTRGQAAASARQQGTRSGQVPRGAVDAGLKSLSLKDKRHSLQSREKEAMRRLQDTEHAAGKPGDNLCRFTGPKQAEEQTGKRPWYFAKSNVGRAASSLCQPVVEEAFDDPAFQKEQRQVCGKDKSYIFPHKRGDTKVKAHCRRLAGPGAAAESAESTKPTEPTEKPTKRAPRSKSQIPKGRKLSAQDKAAIKTYGDSLRRGDKKRMVGRVRIYMLQGFSFEDAKARAEGRDVVTTTARTPGPKVTTGRFLEGEAAASDEDDDEGDAVETAEDREFIDDSGLQ